MRYLDDKNLTFNGITYQKNTPLSIQRLIIILSSYLFQVERGYLYMSDILCYTQLFLTFTIQLLEMIKMIIHNRPKNMSRRATQQKEAKFSFLMSY